MIKLFTNTSAKLSLELLKVLDAHDDPVENKCLQNISNKTNVILIPSGETCELVGDLKCIINAHTSLSAFLKENYNITSDALYQNDKGLDSPTDMDKSIPNTAVDPSNASNGETDKFTSMQTEKKKNNNSGIPDPIVISFRLNDFMNMNPDSSSVSDPIRDTQTTTKEIEQTTKEHVQSPSVETESKGDMEEWDSKKEVERKETKKMGVKSKSNPVKRLKQSKKKEYLTYREKGKRKKTKNKSRKIRLKISVTKDKEFVSNFHKENSDKIDDHVSEKMDDNSHVSNKKTKDNNIEDADLEMYDGDENDDDDADVDWDLNMYSEEIIDDENDSDYKPSDEGCISKKQKTRKIKDRDLSSKNNQHKECDETKNKRALHKTGKNAHDKKDWVCEKCEMTLTSKNEWEKHMEKHLPKNFEARLGIQIDPKAKDIPCPEIDCKYVAREKRHLIEHFIRNHSEKNLHCSHCDAKFSMRRDLLRHERIHGEPKHCCQDCGKFYRCTRAFLEHKKSHEKNYIKPEFTCDTCGKSFSTKYVLQYHIKSEHLGIKKSYLCPTCGKSFTQKNSYVMHANVHLGIRPFVCEICGNSFPYEKSLKEHKYMHDEVKRFKCDICDKTFRQPSALTTHSKIHKTTKEHLCGTCGKGFTQKQALLRHERIHTGDKPFSCTVCGRTFSDASIIRRHMIMVHKRDPKEWRSDVQSEVPRQTDFFIEVLEGDKQPQLKQKGRPPRSKDDVTQVPEEQPNNQNDFKSERLALNNFQNIKPASQNIDQSSESRAIAALTLSSMATGLHAENGSQVSVKENEQPVSNSITLLQKQTESPANVLSQNTGMPLTGQPYPVGCYTTLQTATIVPHVSLPSTEAPSTLNYQGYPQSSDSVAELQNRSTGEEGSQNYQDISVSSVSRNEPWPSQFQYNVMYLASDFAQFQQNH